MRDSLLRKLQTKQELFTKFDVDFILQIFKEYIIHNFYVPRMEHNNITLQPPRHAKDRFPGGERRVGSRGPEEKLKCFKTSTFANIILL